MPNELTPASPLHSRGRALTRNRVRARPSSGLAVRKCRVAGTTPVRTACTALISEAMPAAASRWPMLVFTEPSTHSGPAASASASAATSIGSPSRVPVPC